MGDPWQSRNRNARNGHARGGRSSSHYQPSRPHYNQNAGYGPSANGHNHTSGGLIPSSSSGYSSRSYVPPPPPDHEYIPPPPPDYGYVPPPPPDYGYVPPPPSRPAPWHDTNNGRQDRRASDHYGYSFRGAAATERHDFSFRAQGPSAPSFPPPRQPPRQSEYRGEPPAKRVAREYPRGNGRPAQAKRPFQRRHGPPPTHERALLKAARETTPEQLKGMSNVEPRFRDVDNVDISAVSPPRIVQSTTRWSNPDPYDALPPIIGEGAPRKDIVKVIRKAKVEASKSATGKNAVEENADFISFDMEEDDHISVSSGSSSSSDRASGGIAINVPGSSHGGNIEFFSSDSHPHSSHHGSQLPSMVSHEATSARGQKRKHAHESDSAGLCPGWLPVAGEDSTPWFAPLADRENITNPGQRLHEEICDFYEYVRPQPFEEAVRLDLINRLQATMNNFHGFRQAVEVHAFGSFASGLYLPCADMDLVILSSGFLQGYAASVGQHAIQIRDLATHLRRIGFAAGNQVTTIIGARVPLIKFTDKLTGLKVDISFENPSGLWALRTFQQWQTEFPQMPVIVSLIKQLLAMRGQNEVHTGGLGGFSVICLVVSMLQLMPEIQLQAMQATQHYGLLLQNLLTLYGEQFDLDNTGITMSPPGYYDKTAITMAKKYNPYRLTIIDPNNNANDISGGSRNVAEIFDMFRNVKHALHARLESIKQDCNDTQSILGCVMAGRYSQFEEQRDHLRQVYAEIVRRHITPKAPNPPDLSRLPQVVVTSLRKIARATGPRAKRSAKNYPPRPFGGPR